jgi:hypothetical protein
MTEVKLERRFIKIRLLSTILIFIMQNMNKDVQQIYNKGPSQVIGKGLFNVR